MWSEAFKSVNFSKDTPLKLHVLFKLGVKRFPGLSHRTNADGFKCRQIPLLGTSGCMAHTGALS